MLSSHSFLSRSASSSCFLLFSNSSSSLHRSGFFISFAKVFRRVRSSIPKLFCCSNTVNNAFTSTISSSLSRAIRYFPLQIEMSRCSSLDLSNVRLIFSSNCLYSFLLISNRSTVRRRSHFLIPSIVPSLH